MAASPHDHTLPPAAMKRWLPESMTISPSGVMHLAGHSLPDLARRFGTPLYLFDRATILQACAAYREAFTRHYMASPAHILYASKAYLSPLIASLVDEQGMGLDVVSGGELLVARQAHFPMERVSFHGNNKTEDELRLALQLRVGRIVLDNWHEIARLTRLARAYTCHPQVLLRITPDIAVETHRYLQTGLASSKFGFSLVNGEAKRAIEYILGEAVLSLVGLHAHVGTMVTDVEPYQLCLERLLALARDAHTRTGWWPEEVSPGGGWAVDASDTPSPPPIRILAEGLQAAMVRAMAEYHTMSVPTLVVEPGRSIIARAGVALYTVGARKATAGGVHYLFVDGGMADNIRPALYGARYQAFAAAHALMGPEERVTIAGRYCESGDILVNDAELPRLDEDDLVLIAMTGAYCLPLASNYNLVPRPAVALVDEQQVRLMERRETYNDILARYPMA